MKNDCANCEASSECWPWGASPERRLRERIKVLRELLAIVSKCERRRRWDAITPTKGGVKR